MRRVSLRRDVQSRMLPIHNSRRQWLSFGRWSSDALHCLNRRCSSSQWCHRCRCLTGWSSDSLRYTLARTLRQQQWAMTQSGVGLTRPESLRSRKLKFYTFFLLSYRSNVYSLSRVRPHPTIVPRLPKNRLFRWALVGNAIGWIEAENVNRRRRNLFVENEITIFSLHVQVWLVARE
jgi:hypothetical protein